MNIGSLLKKYYRWEKLLKKEESYMFKKLRDEADRVCSIFIRNRDKKDWCVTCNGPVQHNCHWIDRAWYSHRWDENNCRGGCANCNTYHAQEHWMKFTIYQIKKFWQEWVDEQLRKRHKKKPRIDELLEIIKKYKEKI